MTYPTHIQKRNGAIVPFDSEKISNAIRKAFVAESPPCDRETIETITETAISLATDSALLPAVEQIQDAVENALMQHGYRDIARAYIRYRHDRTKERAARPVPDDVRAAFQEADRYFPTPLQQFQFFDKYSRFDHEQGRRETWPETVNRSVSHLAKLSNNALPPEVYDSIRRGILAMEVLPSMRLLAMAGPAADRQNLCIYNCAYIPIQEEQDFVELLILAMNGVGVGYSVEKANIDRLPQIKPLKPHTSVTHVIGDSIEGWAEALRFGITRWFIGYDVVYDYSQVRPAGSVLRTKGGRASGPEPLRAALNYVRAKIQGRAGHSLRPIDAHDIACAIGAAVVSGGVRRTALLSLFDIDDKEMLAAKDGDYDNAPRWMANNSAVWNRHYDQAEVMAYMAGMVAGERGEPGIYVRSYSPNGRTAGVPYGPNPCGEIDLRPYQLCNLSSVICRPSDTLETLRRKVKLATIIGTIQSMATNFPGMRSEWQRNCEEERLLGVDLNGQMDTSVLTPEVFACLRTHARLVNLEFAQMLGINPSAAITCVKPSGNSSLLVNASSGLHPRHAPYYIRRVRENANTPIFQVLRSSGVPMVPEVGQEAATATTWVVSFPVKSPEGAKTRKDVSALEMLEWWLQNKLHWTDHNPSVTIHYTLNEVLDIARWVYDNQGKIGGISFLPLDGAKYELMPYEEITAEEYERLAAAFPAIDFSKLYRYENQDMTTTAQEFACVGGACELL